MRYLPLQPADRQAMLAVIGAASIDDLFVDVPAAARLSGPDRRPADARQPSWRSSASMTALAAQNLAAGDAPFFLGAAPIAITFPPASITSSSAASS